MYLSGVIENGNETEKEHKMARPNHPFDSEDLDRLQEIKDQMLALLEEANLLVAKTDAGQEWHSYVGAHIRIALDSDHGFMSKDTNFQDVIDNLAVALSEVENGEAVEDRNTARGVVGHRDLETEEGR